MPELDFETIFDHSPNAYLLLAPDLTVVGVNQRYLEVAGRGRDEVMGRGVFEIFPDPPGESNARQLRASFHRVLATRRAHTLAPLRYPVSRGTPNGEVWDERYWSTRQTPILDAQGEVSAILHHPFEISLLVSSTAASEENIARQAQVMHEINTALEAERRHMRQLFEQAPGFIAVGHGPDHVFELANKAYYQLVGHREILGRPVREALPELEGQGFFELLDKVYTSGEPFIGRAMPIMFEPQPGAPPIEKHIDFIYQPIREGDGEVSGIFVQGHDVSEAHQLAQQISHQAAHDPLTGIPNRREFERRLDRVMEGSQGQATRHSLLYLDLDQFKVVNDTCGHAAGDELLRQVSRALAGHIREADTLARLGGDEFAVLLPNCGEGPAQRIAEELRERVAEVDFRWERRRFSGSISIGVVTFGSDGLTGKEALSTADAACFLAKEKGRNRVHAYHPEDAEMAARLREMDWISRLGDALREDRIVLYAQHIAPLDDDAVTLRRKEILLRLREPDGTIVPPGAFIPAAERYSLMPAIDRRVIQKAFRHLAGLPDSERGHTQYSINLSGTTLSDRGFPHFVAAQLAEHGIAPEQICFEITETTAVANLSETVSLIHTLKGRGFRFALDDFGSGMSSFGYLKHLPVDFLKIDGVFIRNLLDDPVDCAMVEAIAGVARVMNIKTVAEYVENESVIERLVALGVNFAQGYGVHRPEPLA